LIFHLPLPHRKDEASLFKNMRLVMEKSFGAVRGKVGGERRQRKAGRG